MKAQFIILILNFTNTRKKGGGNKWLEDEEGNPKKWQKWGWEKKKEKTEGETECFLVSSGGLAFVWNENSECLRDYSGLAGPWEPSSYLYTSNMEYGNHRSVCVCVHAEKCMRLLLWADEWQFKQTHNVVNQKIKKQTKNKKAFSVWPHLLLHLYASMKFHRALFLFYSVLSLGHRLCFSSTFIHTFTASLLHPSRWGRKNAATLHWFWEAVILGLRPTSD